MSGRISSRMAAILMAAAITMAFAAPASAAHEDGHEKGKSGSNERSSWTEDNDTNDGGTPNNQADDGDNMHPSGKDRSVENGKSGNQGWSKADPDDDGRGPDRSNGGADKPNGPGGVDKADQDGNNGCGNDDDFEDDNEGLCGNKPKKDRESKVKGNSAANVSVEVDCYTVTVASSKDISHVEVTFVDGSVVKFEGLSEGAWTQTFDQAVASAKAKSGTSVASAMDTGTCVEGSDEVVCPEGSEMNVDGSCVTEAGDIVCPVGHEMTGEECTEVLGDTLVDVDLKEDGATAEDDTHVLGGSLSAAPDDDEASGPLARAANVLGEVLPFTGAGLVKFLILAAALVLIGLFLARRRSTI